MKRSPHARQKLANFGTRFKTPNLRIIVVLDFSELGLGSLDEAMELPRAARNCDMVYLYLLPQGCNVYSVVLCVVVSQLLA